MRAHDLLVPLALALAGCGGIGFDVTQDLPEQTVMGAVNPLTGIIPDFLAQPVPINIDLTAETKKRNTGPASHAYLTALSLSATPHDKPSGNFDFLTDVHVFIESQGNGTLPTTEIATLDPVPRGH